MRSQTFLPGWTGVSGTSKTANYLRPISYLEVILELYILDLTTEEPDTFSDGQGTHTASADNLTQKI